MTGIFFLIYQGFLSQALTIHRTAEEVRGPSLSLSTTPTRSLTFRHLLASLHVRLLTTTFQLLRL